ncbi:MAG: hypothetical protein LBL47_02095, partial [Lactobacillus sp.]|nr:hypothetical protein [Lactobacillus sp.]
METAIIFAWLTWALSLLSCGSVLLARHYYDELGFDDFFRVKPKMLVGAFLPLAGELLLRYIFGGTFSISLWSLIPAALYTLCLNTYWIYAMEKGEWYKRENWSKAYKHWLRVSFVGFVAALGLATYVVYYLVGGIIDNLYGFIAAVITFLIGAAILYSRRGLLRQLEHIRDARPREVSQPKPLFKILEDEDDDDKEEVVVVKGPGFFSRVFARVASAFAAMVLFFFRK